MQGIVLEQLVNGSALERVRGDAAGLLRHCTADSRRVVEGGAFIAIAGHDADGHDFLADAVARHPRAVVVARGQAARVPGGHDLSVYECEQPRRLLGAAMRALYGSPDRELKMVAVTGTNGKTTTTHVVRDLLERCGRRCGLLGTIRYRTGARDIEAPLTTPGVEDFYRYLSEMCESGLDAIAFEASSHALDQERLGPCEVDVATFLNVTREHLDYHSDLENYRDAKLRLRERLTGTRRKPEGRSVVNADDPVLMGVEWPEGTLFFGRSERADLRLLDARPERVGLALSLEHRGRRRQAQSRLIGSYNVENLMAAIASLLALGLDIDEILDNLPEVRPVPGRMETVDLAGGPLCLIDYAHTADGIASALAAARPFVRGELRIVFGCGGDRDRGKRAPMAQAALAGADRAFLTLDNPRTEDPERIFADALAGFADDPRGELVRDRREAIANALHGLGPEDGLLIAGKGHERYQIIGREKTPWDDRVVVRDCFGGGR